LRNVIAVATTLVFGCTRPWTWTFLPAARVEHEPFAKLVKLPVVTVSVPAVRVAALNVVVGHLPVIDDKRASNSVGTPVGVVDELLVLLTITDVAQESSCFWASVAVHMTAVVPIGKDDPDAGTQLVVTGATPPLTVGLKVTFTGLPLCETTGAMSGHEIDSGAIVEPGATVDVTITFELHEALASTASMAVQTRPVVPTGKSDPEAGTQLDFTGAVPPDTVGAYVTTTGFPSDDVADGAGHMIASGVLVGGLYVTTTDVLHDEVNFRESVAVHVVGVEPTGKSDPDAGEHVAVTGAVPPDTAGEKVTTTGLPSVDEPTGTGHWMAGGAPGAPDVMPDTSYDGGLMVPDASYARTMK
jgi:hypothetical protein